jgi:hypothetical protein
MEIIFSKTPTALLLFSVIALLFCSWLFKNSYRKLGVDENFLESSIIRAFIGILASTVSLD